MSKTVADIVSANLGILAGTSTGNPNAILEVVSTTQGILPPRMTEAQKNLITPTQGMLVYDTDIDDLFYSTASDWLEIGNGKDFGHKQPVSVASTAPGVLATSFSNGDTIDGIVLSTGDRILIKDQAALAENGVYIVTAGVPTRAPDFSSSNQFVLGSKVLITRGTVNSGTTYYVTVSPAVVGTNDWSWTVLGAAPENIYTINGTLLGTRTVTMSGNDLVFDGSGGNVSITDAGLILGSVGFSSTVPKFAFGSDTDTGIGLSSAGNIAFITGGASEIIINSQGMEFNSGGSAAAPNLVWNGSTTTGLFSTVSDTIGFSTLGVAKFTIEADGTLVSNLSNYETLVLNDDDIPNRKFVVDNSIAFKSPVLVATTANGVLATAYDNGQTVDGVSLSTGDRILLKDQTDPIENGVYIVQAAGAPVRAADLTTSDQFALGTRVSVQAGTANAGNTYYTSTLPATVGTNAWSWVDQATAVAGDDLGNHTATQQILAIAGSAAASSYAFTGDVDTGMYLSSVGTLSLATAGVERVSVTGETLNLKSFTAGNTFTIANNGVTGVGQNTGNILLTTTTANTANSGTVTIQSGDSSVGAGSTSGDVNINTGSGINSGTINIQPGTSTSTGVGNVAISTPATGTVSPSGDITVGTGNSSIGASGDLVYSTGSGATTSGVITLTTGNSSSSSGGLTITTGDAAATGTVGQIGLIAGSSSVNANGGSVLLQASAGSGTGVGGNIQLHHQAGAGFTIDNTGLLSTNVSSYENLVILANSIPNKAYVDSIATGLDLKPSVRVKTVAALPSYTQAGTGIGATLTADANGILTIDGIATVLGNRILVDQNGAAAGADAGIYTVTTEGTAGVPFVLTRAVDSDENAEVTSGMFCFVEEGSIGQNAGFVLTTDGVIVVDTTTLNFSQFSAAAAAAQSVNDLTDALNNGSSINIGGLVAGGVNNTILGIGAGALLSTGTSGVYLGSNAGNSITTGALNVMIGVDSDGSSNSANGCVGVGQSVTCANDTVVIGRNASGTGISSAVIGISASATTASAVALGNTAVASATNAIALGAFSVGNIAAGLFLPSSTANGSATTLADVTEVSGAKAVQFNPVTGQMGPAATALVLPAAAGDPATSIAGSVAFNSSGNQLKYHNGTVWKTVQSDESVSFSQQTTNATPTTVITQITLSNSSTLIEVTAGAIRSDFTEGASFSIKGSFRNNGGVLTQIGTTFKVTMTDDILFDINFNINGSNVEVQITGAAGKTLNWDGKVLPTVAS